MLSMHLSRQGALPEARVHSIFGQLIAGVEHCHKQGICHRDLKLSNLLLDGEGRLLVADFGLATLKDGESGLYAQALMEPPTEMQKPQPKGQLWRAQTMVGTLQYTAPEVYMTKGIYSKEYQPEPADIWSCGVLLYVLLTGQFTFDDPDRQKLMNDVRTAHFEWPEEGIDIGSEPKALVHQILQPDPSKRITIDAIKQNRWVKSAQISKKRLASRKMV